MVVKRDLPVLLCLILAFACGTDRGHIATPEAKEKAVLQTAQARVFLNAGLYEEAYSWAKDALNENPAHLEAVEIASESLLHLARIQEAFTLLQGPLPPGAGDGWREGCLRQAARLALAMDQPSKAVIYLKRAVAEVPDDASLYTLLGEAQLKSDQELAASASFENALERGGARARILPQYAEALFRLEEYEKAPDVARKRLSLDAMESVLARVGSKTIIDDSVRGILPMLNLDQGRPIPVGERGGQR